MKRIILLLLFQAVLIKAIGADYMIKGVSDPVISLNGKWSICLNPTSESYKGSGNWQSIQVPGECMMQGLKIKYDQPFVYKKEIRIPSDFKQNRLVLRFEGVYSYAKLWVNGKFIREHSGGFTTWEADITKDVVLGSTALIILEVTDKADEISYASGYAKHPIGGILRTVSLMAVPFNFPDQISITTDFDLDYKNAKLMVQAIFNNASNSNHIEAELFDSTNHKITLSNYSFNVNDSIGKLINEINKPIKWDAEHPNLYRLKISLVEGGKISCYKNYFFGFRKIEIKGNRFLVNGQQVKLRGACRHDVHPLLGRVATPEYDLKDVLLAKEANINFIRTSHYPPTERFLELCDKYGIYVEDETAVCFVNTYRSPEYAPGATENNTDYSARYLTQLEEMVKNHRNHPSVILWSIGNENKSGINFQKSYEWVKKEDPTRPVIFSFPGTVKEVNKTYDILSMHYPNIDGSLEQYGITVKDFDNKNMPVLFDEWAHVPCYNSSTIKEDPNVRDFWGMSLDSMWQKTHDADGGLGGAIWGMIDETFMLPDTTVGYGEWGIVDTWRRKKPEFWNVKKAYSPVRVLYSPTDGLNSRNMLSISIYNRYDYTNLSELSIRYKLKGVVKTLPLPSIPPHTKGNIQLPTDLAYPLQIEFIDKNHSLVDNYYLVSNTPNSKNEKQSISGKINFNENEKQYIIYCEDNLNIFLSKETGLFTGYQVSGSNRIFSGPWLNFRTKGQRDQTSSTQYKNYGEDWKLKRLSVTKAGNVIDVNISGEYKLLPFVEFNIKIYSDGSTLTDYKINDLPKEYLRESGLKFVLDDQFDSLSWRRIGYWSIYPSDHLSASEGKIPLNSKEKNLYRNPPVKTWQNDTKSYFYDGVADEETDHLILSSKATKENILEYNLLNKNEGSITITGTGKEGCRINKSGNKIEIFINTLWDYPDIAWGNYQKNILPDKEYSGHILLTIHSK